MMNAHNDLAIAEGSTNVYADLGYADAAEMQRKSQLAAEIARAIKARRLTQDGTAALLGIDQSKVSRITRGQFRGVSEAKLLELVTKLGHDVKIVVGPVRRRASKKHQAVCLCPACVTLATLAALALTPAMGRMVKPTRIPAPVARLTRASRLNSPILPLSN
jgi:predicted XRE-type DNA-binding protein